MPGFAQTDLIITGVFDADLSGGTPKGVELYALNDIADLSIYGLEAANNGTGAVMEEFTFPADAATAGSFIYVTLDNIQFNTFFGFDADYENGGNPSAVAINGDDAVVLYREGTVVDVFGDPDTDGTGEGWEYTDGWAYRVSGTGPDAAFVLSNWTYALTGLDGADTNDQATMPFPIGTYTTEAGSISANNDQITLTSGESATIDILANDFLPNGFTDLTLMTMNLAGTATLNADNTVTYTTSPDFCGTESFTYEVCDDQGCATAEVAVSVLCYPEYNIGLVTTVDADGVADSLDLLCQLRGVVHGVNLRASGLAFAIIDENNDGISLFSFSETYGYEPNLGDEVIVRGAIDQFNGLTQVALDTIWLVSAGNDLFEPTEVTDLNEDTESQFILLNDLYTLVDPGEWDDSGASFNVAITNGTDTHQMRIDEDTEIAGTPAPTMPFRVFGIGGQFDNEEPFTEGYQILPRFLTDIDFEVSTRQERPAGWAVFPNPVTDLLTVQNEGGFDAVLLRDAAGRILRAWRNVPAGSRLEMGALPNGMYLLQLQGEDTRWSTPILKK